MHEIRADQSKNRLYITLGGFSSLDQVEQTVQEVKQAIQNLRPGFDVITDVSSYRPAREEVAAAIQQMQVFLKSAGMRRVVRVLSSSAIAGMQFNRLGKEAGYQASHVSSLEEAEKLLES